MQQPDRECRMGQGSKALTLLTPAPCTEDQVLASLVKIDRLLMRKTPCIQQRFVGCAGRRCAQPALSLVGRQLWSPRDRCAQHAQRRPPASAPLSLMHLPYG